MDQVGMDAAGAPPERRRSAAAAAAAAAPIHPTVRRAAALPWQNVTSFGQAFFSESFPRPFHDKE